MYHTLVITIYIYYDNINFSIETFQKTPISTIVRTKDWKKHRGKTTTINLLVENFYSHRECTLTVTYRLTNMGLQFHSFSPHPSLSSPSRKGTARVARETCQSEGNEKHVERREPEGYSIAQRHARKKNPTPTQPIRHV